jgi:hypothetical protein
VWVCARVERGGGRGGGGRKLSVAVRGLVRGVWVCGRVFKVGTLEVGKLRCLG